jgi:hypothetical protein
VRTDATHDRYPITLNEGDTAIARMPTRAERLRLHLALGTPIIEIRNADGVTTDILPATAVTVTTL